MADLEVQLLISSYVRMKRAIDSRGGCTVGYDSHEYVQSVENYIKNDCDFGCDFSYENYESIEAEFQRVTSLAPFAFGMKLASVYYFNNLRLYVVENNAEHSEVIGQLNELDVLKLLEFCDKSPFGDLLNQETKNVREAKEVTSDRIVIKRIDHKKNVESFLSYDKTRHHSAEGTGFVSTIEEKIRNHFLGSDATYDIQLVFHKLIIHSENGHFKPHADSPTHDPALFIGTVVVCLPSEHTGGDLIVRHRNETICFNFADKSAEKECLQFAAFYGDCEHEVLPVTSGHRVVLTYSILRGRVSAEYFEKRAVSKSLAWCNADAFARNGQASRPLNEAETIPAALNTAFDAIQKLMDKPVFGLFLGNESGLTAEGLKGADKLFYDFFHSKNIPISLVPVVTTLDYCELQGGMYEGGGVRDLKKSNFTVQTIKDLPDLRLEEHKHLSSDTPFLTPWGNIGFNLMHKETDCDGYDSVQRMYLKGAMIVGPFPGIPLEGRETEVTIYPGVECDSDYEEEY